MEIRIYRIAKTVPDSLRINAWLEANHDCSLEEIYGGIDGAELLIGLAGKQCYRSFKVGLNPNITKIRDDWVAYLTNILESGHGSVLEHASYTYAIEGISRVFTGEMNRHRAGVAISERSMRYVRYDELPFWIPLSIRGSTPEEEKTRAIFQEVFTFINKKYKELETVWKDKLDAGDFYIKKQLTSLFRRIIPMGIATGGIWTFNLRALRHVLTVRCDPSAEEEIQYVCLAILRDIKESCPTLFKDFDINGKPKYRKV